MMNEERWGFQIMAFVREGMINSGQQLAHPEEGGFEKTQSSLHTPTITLPTQLCPGPLNIILFFFYYYYLENLGNLAEKIVFFFLFSLKHTKSCQCKLKSVIIESTEEFRSPQMDLPA